MWGVLVHYSFVSIDHATCMSHIQIEVPPVGELDPTKPESSLLLVSIPLSQ